ncbi:MAG TPA: class I SAM-dependent methyltransferase [Burkholderiaceae bacterium]|jgi:methyltransferase (TIGR00027 family)
MNPISDTAFLTCGARAADAAATKPICGDSYAHRFLDERGQQVFEKFKSEKGPLASIVARHRLIDDLLRARIADDKATNVVIIGAGFDTRAFRLEGGNWAEIDEPQVVDLKNRVLPAERAANPLRRIAIDFAGEELANKLPTVAPGSPVVVVMEGIFIYLDEQQIDNTLRSLQQAYPGHTLICDLNSRRFMERHGKSLKQQIETLGATLKYLSDEPSAIFLRHGYRPTDQFSIIDKTLEYMNARIGRFLVKLCMPTLVDGLMLFVFAAPRK